MTCSPLSRRTVRVARFLIVTLIVGGVATGIVMPAKASKPVVEGKVRTLASLARRGWLRSVQTPMASEMVGFDWAGRMPGTIEVRVEDAKGWTDWSTIDGFPAEGPDSTSKEAHNRTSAGPVWIGHGVRQVQVRVADGDLGDLRLHAIHTGSTGSSGPAQAHAAVSQPGIISRAQWGADESWRSYASGCNGSPDYADGVRYAIVHHTDNSNSYSASDSASIVRGIYYFHTHTNGWCDIGYNFLVDAYGQVFEGRWGGITSAVIGAHAGGFNTNSTGVAVIGNFQSTALPGPAYGALRGLLAWKLGYHHVNANSVIQVVAGDFNGSKYPAGTTISVPTISAHRDVDETDCPGDVAYGELGQLRVDVQHDIEAAAWNKPAVVRSNVWFLRRSMTPGPADITFVYGDPGDLKIMCDWNGDGVRTPGVYRNGVFFLRNSNTSGPADVVFPFGQAGDIPVCGDWDGDHVETVGVVRDQVTRTVVAVTAAKMWYLRNRNSAGPADGTFAYGNVGDRPFVGDWDGNSFPTPGVRRGYTWYLRNSNSGGIANGTFNYGDSSDTPIPGNWNDDPYDTLGITRGGAWFIRDANASGNADFVFPYGNSGDVPLIWR